MLAGIVLSFVVSISGSFAADSLGYVSTDKNDLPPNLERDVSAQSVDPERAPAYGPLDAKVVLVKFADFGCPACRRASQATHQIAGEFPGDVRIEFWNNPLEIHSNADLAAKAAIAAQQQGKFWEMHDMLYGNTNHDMATIEQHAEELGLDLPQFKSDINSAAVNDRLKDEIALAKALGARRTPTYFVNGKFREGWGSWIGLKMMVERELKAANTLSEQGLDPSEIQEQRAIDNMYDSEQYELYRRDILHAE